MAKQYYLQDSRSYVGNDILFWADGGGYTTDVSKAEVMTEEEAFRLNRNRDSDIPWPKDYIDSKVRPAVDMQYVNNLEALRDTGRKVYVQPKPKRVVTRCHHCGKFVSEYDARYGFHCPHCAQDMWGH
jgi:hypothetical protein